MKPDMKPDGKLKYIKENNGLFIDNIKDYFIQKGNNCI